MNSEEQKKFNEELAKLYPECMIMEEYADCVIGIASRIGMDPVVAYDQEKLLEKLASEDGMTMEDAIEHFEFNIIGAYVGEGTPVFISREILDHINVMESFRNHHN